MPVLRYRYVKGTGSRRHILLPGKRDPVCGVFYFGSAGLAAFPKSFYPKHYWPNPKCPVCKHCLGMIGK